MHPAASLIAFTTLSGLGFGLMACLGADLAPLPGWQGAALAALAPALAGAGLLASLLHLGQPHRFLKAFSQWRSSWLSREAVLAMATFAAFGLFVLAWALLEARSRWLGVPVAALALATVAATSMIYAQLRSVPRWHTPLTSLLFLLPALAGGALLAGAAEPAAWALGALGLVQLAAWVLPGRGSSTLATATGLGPLGRLRLLAPPHTGSNYLLREMVHVVGRRHAAKLRAIGFLLAVALPLALLAAALPAPVAAVPHVLGVVVLRWLFFAEAQHVVGLYYGRS